MVNYVEQLFGNLNEYSSEVWENAIIVALATHADSRVRNLTSEYSESEINQLIKSIPIGLLLITQMSLVAALTPTKPECFTPQAKALREQIERLFVEKKQYDAFLKAYPQTKH